MLENKQAPPNSHHRIFSLTGSITTPSLKMFKFLTLYRGKFAQTDHLQPLIWSRSPFHIALSLGKCLKALPLPK